KLTIECEVFSYAAVTAIARQIASEVAEVVKGAQCPPEKTIVLLDRAALSAFQLLGALDLQVGLFEKSFGGVGPEEEPPPLPKRFSAIPGAAMSTITGALGGVLDLLALFRQETQLSGLAVTVRESAVLLEIAHFLRKQGQT